MKVFVYIGIAVVILGLASVDFSNLMFMQATLASYGEFLNVLFIGLGIAQATSILLLIKPKNRALANFAEVTLLISSLVLVLNGYLLFVMGNVVLMFISKLVFAKPSEDTEDDALEARHAV